MARATEGIGMDLAIVTLKAEVMALKFVILSSAIPSFWTEQQKNLRRPEVV
jgi:hypothetical protein